MTRWLRLALDRGQKNDRLQFHRYPSSTGRTARDRGRRSGVRRGVCFHAGVFGGEAVTTKEFLLSLAHDALAECEEIEWLNNWHHVLTREQIEQNTERKNNALRAINELEFGP
jgi:hypothetical protein